MIIKEKETFLLLFTEEITLLNTKDEFDFQVLKLTKKFFDDYDSRIYPEILAKHGRSYNCLLIQSHYGYFVCIPYRSEINHAYAFKFVNTKRSQKCKSGLDYTKIVIISNDEYLSEETSFIDADEYAKTRQHIRQIKDEATSYVDNYVAHVANSQHLTAECFVILYSSIPRFLFC